MGRPALQHKGLIKLPLILQIQRVLVGAAHHISGTIQHGLQGPRATHHVFDFHLQTLGLEVTELFGQGQRQVIERGLAPHSNGDFCFFGARLGVQAGRKQTERAQAQCGVEVSALKDGV